MKMQCADSRDGGPQHRTALSTWDDEGGAQPATPLSRGPPDLGNAELMQLRVRVIALENVVIALLRQSDEAQLSHVRTMADHIAPRPGATAHPLTTQAADQILQLVERAVHSRSASTTHSKSGGT